MINCTLSSSTKVILMKSETEMVIYILSLIGGCSSMSASLLVSTFVHRSLLLLLPGILTSTVFRFRLTLPFFSFPNLSWVSSRFSGSLDKPKLQRQVCDLFNIVCLFIGSEFSSGKTSFLRDFLGCFTYTLFIFFTLAAYFLLVLHQPTSIKLLWKQHLC